MYRLASLALLFFPLQLLSQLFPKEGSKLNYRIIGFSFPRVKGDKCTLEIAAGTYYSEDSFRKNVIKSIDCNANKMIAEIPAFGCAYTWRISAPGKHSIKGGLHHFSALNNPKTDTAVSRLRIINKAKQYKDAYVFIDCMQALYDMDGKVVWFLPDSSYLTGKISNAIDLKLSPANTITFIINDKIKEINYNGDVLWSGPNTGEVSRDTSEHYHHEFTRLANGHYMVMGNEDVAWELPHYKPDSVAEEDIIRGSNNVFRQKLKFGTIIEYDENRKVVWSWRSSDYFKQSVIYERKTPKGRFEMIDVHENSFCFDEKSMAIYVSCRNINQVVKVKYPEGNVLAVYGDTNNEDSLGAISTLFSGQHSIKVSQDGNLYLFNNNTLPLGVPKLLMMKEAVTGNENAKKIWEYDCTLEGLTDAEQGYYKSQTDRRHKRADNNRMKVHFTSGGNVMELPDRSFFASMNGPSSKIFIVGQNKEILWSAIPEQKQPNDTTWGAAPTYRASIISNRKDLEQLIWNAEGKEKQ